MMKIFGIPNCDTVKKARTFLGKINIQAEFVDFKKYTPTNDDIKRWTEAFGGYPVNYKGVTYKKHKEHFESLAPSEKVSFLQENTSMIKRPVLEKDGKVLAFGFDEELYRSVLK
jgi:arsenate reductase (glutaredoxin)